MRALGKIPVIWGTLLPMMILPTIADYFDRRVAILNIRLDREAYVGPFAVDFDTIIVFGLLIVGIGLPSGPCRD